MRKNSGRFSVYLRPFSYLLDLLIVNLLASIILLEPFQEVYFYFFISLSWVVISWNVQFYEVFRFTKVLNILEKIVKQYIVFVIVNFAYIGYFLKSSEPSQILKYATGVIIIVASFKLFIFYFLKQFRIVFGGNFRKVIIVGEEKSTSQLADFFNNNLDYGYKLVSVFSLSENKKQQLEDCLKFVSEKNIDEIYCSLADLTNSDINKFIDFTDNNLKVLKFLPDGKQALTGNFKHDFYGYIPIISLRNIPLDSVENKIIKRFFDIIFSLIIIVGIMSWLIPILAFFIKLESKGPVFFKQRRNGLNYHEFDCYKFRSMTLNEIADIEQVSKNDPRITRTGRFIRKTSIDELPQFFNVFLGDMSVVGPRPHMVSHTEMYAKRVDKFMVRHFIKPGITGMAQTNGYRGEVESEKDIINRVKLDIFYLENWSLLLDLKIVFLTIINAVKGEAKAY